MPTLGFVELIPLAIGGELLTGVVAALFITLIFIAGWVILWILHLALGRVSILGFHPFNFFYNLATDALKSTWHQFKRYVPPFARLLWSWVMTIWRPLYVILELITHLTGQIIGVQQNSNQGLAQVRAQEQTDIANARAYAEQQASAAIADAGHLYNLAEGDIVNSRVAAENFATAQANVAIADAEHLYNLAEGDIVNSRVAAENFATEQARAAISDAEHLYNLVEGDLFNTKAELQGSINTVEKAIPTVANEVVTSATPSILAKAAAAVQAKLTPIQTEINDCLTPLCDTVTPQAPRIGRLGNLLKGLEDLGIEALLVALAAECLANPAAVARDVDAVTKDIGDPLMAAYRDLIGA